MSERRDQREGRNRAWLWLGAALLIAVFVLVAVWGGLKYQRVRACVDSTLTRLRFVQGMMPEGAATPTDLNLVEVGAQLHGLQDDLVCLRTEVGVFFPLAPLLGWLPKIGPDAASAPALFDMAQALVDGGVLIFDGMSPLVAQMQVGDQAASEPERASLDLPQLVAALKSAQPALAAAEAKLEYAAELQSGIGPGPQSEQLRRLLEITERYLPLLIVGVRAGQIVPELLGAEGERTYLILAQNDDERRPTGGWISGMGLVTIANGQVEDVIFQDSWAVDNLNVPHDAPPDSMFRALWAEMWLFRDANWSPDFPTSAQVAESILERDQGILVDGVFAVDQQALRLLVASMEPLVVESSEEPITGANVVGFIRDSWTEPEEGVRLTEGWAEWTAHRKDFMPDLVEAMMDRIQTQPESLDLSRLAAAIGQGLQGKHILVFLHDAEAAELLASQKWDGAMQEASGDYLQVVDANVGFNKVDPFVKRTVTYDVDLTNAEQFRADVSVHYENNSRREVEDCVQEIEWLPSYQQRMHGCYWDYVRVYTPEGARLLSVEREPLPPGSLLSRYGFAPKEDAGPDTAAAARGKTAFGLFFALPPGEQKEVNLTWQLPHGAVSDEAGGKRYRLYVQKQSGAPAIPLRVRVALPPGSQIVETIPLPTDIQVETVMFDLSLDRDHVLEVAFQESGAGEP